MPKQSSFYPAPYATVFVSSACIMIVELLAGRLISRHVGQSLYTWTAVIGVMLAGIAAGNYLGGLLADRSYRRRTLALQLMLAALACLVVFPLNSLAGALFSEVSSWPLRIFLHVLVTFLLPSTVLGTISPVIARRALQVGDSAGRVVGNVYAWATAGSIFGTFFTGFYLLMHAGTTYAAGGAAAILALLGLLYAAGSFGENVSAKIPDGIENSYSEATGKAGIFWLVVAIFLANVCIMAVELCAGRVLSRYFGQSLYTWTTIIGVIMAGMTLGSYWGGRLAQRVDAGRIAGRLFVAASISCLIIPIVAKPVYNFVYYHSSSPYIAPLPLKVAVFASVIFILPSILIAAVSPILLRAALDRKPDAGRTVGIFFALGSLGSIAGTFFAGFYLVAAVGTVLTFFLVAILLGLLGVICARQRMLAYVWAICGGVALAGLMVPSSPPLLTGGRAWGQFEGSRTVYAAESQYSCINVLANEEEPDIRELVLDRLIHSKIDLRYPADLKYEYEWVYETVMNKFYPPPQPVTALVIGGGGYTYPRHLELMRPGSHVEVAEIDPGVTEAAMSAFGLPRDTKIEIHHMDARNRTTELVRAKRAGLDVPQYDLIFGDSVNDYSVPYHLTTREFNQQVYELLNDNGLYLLNMIDIFEPGKFLAAVVNTCRQTFPYVYVFSRYEDRQTRDTFIVVNSKRPLDVADIPARCKVDYVFEGSLLPQEELDKLIEANGGLVLTDDFAPVENLLAPVVMD